MVESDPYAVNQTRSACVYTTLIGDYEKLNEQPVAASSRLPFICFTDDPDLQSETWQIQHVKPLYGMDPVRSQRALKVRPYEYLPSFDVSLYIDNSVLLKIEPEQFIERYLGESGFCLPEHSFRESVLDEFLEVEAQSLDDPGRIFEQLNHYTMEFPELLQERAYWTGMLLRDHRNPKVRTMLELWWAHVQRYSRRDQLSINVALKESGLRPAVLRIDNRDSSFHAWPIRADRIRKRQWPTAISGYPVARLNEAERHIRKLERKNNFLKQSLAKTREILKAQRRKNKALHASNSWRLTAPIRLATEAYQSIAKRWSKSRTPAGAMQLRNSKQRRKGPSLSQSAGAVVSTDHDRETFFREGFIGPLDLFTPAQCELILKHHRLGGRRVSRKWPKGRAAKDRFFYDLATHPRLVKLLEPLLGEDIILWGASIVERAPGQTHIWHTDIESSAPDGRFISVWVGLENTSRESALQLISRSQGFGKPIQQEVHERGVRRGGATDETVAAWAREYDPLATFVQPEMHDGQALLLDGRLWHASHNSGSGHRAALLLQYAAAGTPIAIPVFNHVEWPFRFTSAAPPSVLVSGGTNGSSVVPPPSSCPDRASPIRTHLHSGANFVESADGWVPYPLVHGPTPILSAMESHVSVLSPGHSPHPPHCHVEEELLIVLNGEAEILIAKGPDPTDARVERLVAGSFVYYPAYQHHTIRNSSDSPVTYLMFKWQAPLAVVDRPLQTSIFDIEGAPAAPDSKPMSMRVLFESGSGYLNKLHAHVTDLKSGAGYPTHADKHDVAIVVFSGRVETLGKTVGPGGSIYYAAHEPHGMNNAGNEPARYLVFEFH